MNFKITFSILILFLGACAGLQKKRHAKNINHPEITIHSQYWNTVEDSLNLYSYIELPLKNLVFKKKDDHFFSEVTFTLVISTADENRQVFRETWEEVIRESYYENTRDSDNYFRTEKNIPILGGDYKLFINIQDQDSRENWKLTKDLKLKSINQLSPIIPFVKNKDGQMEIKNILDESADTIWLRTQVNFPDTMVAQLKYIINDTEVAIDSGNVSISAGSIHNLYYIPIPLKDLTKSRYEVELFFLEESEKISFDYGLKSKKYWTHDVDEVVGVMQYIFTTHSEYKKLKDMDDIDRWVEIEAYWKDKDPSPETPENPLLEELNNRVRFANKNYSILMHGWRSDRGRIYIIYGEPNYINDSYQDNMGFQYQKWTYSNGKEFLFIDRTMSGDFTLYKEPF